MITINERLELKRATARTGCSTIYEVKIDGKWCIAKIPKIEEVKKLEREAFRAIEARNKQIETIRGAKKGPHPHLVRLLDEVKFLDGEGFLLEKLSGPKLRTVIDMEKGSSVSTLKRLQRVHQVVEGIEELHAAGILNRDIKTDNVMFDYSNGPKIGKSNIRAVVLDFGLAVKKDPKTQEEIGQLEVNTGTPELFAPERFEVQRYGILEEVYSLGALMYEVFTARWFRNLMGVQFSEVPEKIKEEIPRPNRVARVDRDIEDIIMMAIATDPSKRFRSATQMKEAILDALIRRTTGEIEF